MLEAYRWWMCAGLFLFAVAAPAAPAARPWPQPSGYAPGIVRPSMPKERLNATVAAIYDAWKARYFHAGCTPGQAYIAYNLEGRADRKDAISCSEGHGYGMLLTVLLAGHDPKAQESFDALYAWVLAHPSRLTPGLMSWQQIEGCRDVPGENDSASDGDFDIAYALLLASRQWGEDGPVHYREAALRTIAAIKAGDINAATCTVKLGDWARKPAEVADVRTSDFMPDHLRAFGRATNDPLWAKVLDREYACLAALQKQSPIGLWPDFARNVGSDPTPAPPKFLESRYDGQYFYNACRVPWRMGVDALLTGEPRAISALAAANAFIVRATGGDPARIHAGYRLANGKPIDADDTSLAFTAPFAVSAMSEAGRQAWLDRLCARLLEPPGQDEDYYGRTVALLALVAISGHWWSP